MDEPVKASPKVREFLRTELPKWRGEGLVSDEAARSLAQRYRVAAEPPSRYRWFVAAVSILGATLIGGGVILFIASNWGDIPRPVRLLMLEFVIAVMAIGGRDFISRERKPSPILGEALLVLSALCYGGAIALVAQMYHIQSYYPNGMLLWIVGILALAAATRSVPLFTAAMLLTWLRGTIEIVEFDSWSLLTIALALGYLALSYLAGLTVNIIIAFYACLTWLSLQLMRTGFLNDFSGGMLDGFLVAALLITLALAHAPAGEFFWVRRTLRWLGYRLMLVLLYIMSFGEIIDELTREFPIKRGTVLGWTTVISITALVGISLRNKIMAGKRTEALELGYAGGLGLMGCVVLGLMPLEFLPEGLWTIFANFMFIGAALGAFAVGLKAQDAALSFFGILALVVLVLTRFFDAAYEALPQSLAWVVSGIMILGLAFVLERSRKRITGWIEEEEAEAGA